MWPKCVLIFLVLYTVRAQKASPCPGILVYEPRNSELNRWYASVTLSTREQLRGIWLTIILDRPAELLGNLFGDATSNDNREFIIRSQNYILEAGTSTPVRFFVKYNKASTVPSVTEINLNGRLICSSSNPIYEQTTSRNPVVQSRPTGSNSNGRPTSSSNGLNNRPRPTSNVPNNSGGTATNSRPTIVIDNNSGSGADLTIIAQSGDDFFAGDFSTVVSRPPSRPTRPNNNRDQQCGTVAAQAAPLISYGQNTTPGQWPWHAALYHSKGLQLMYTCGGTLISTTHILTAAHCITKPRTSSAINPQNILVYLGKYNLKKFGSEIQDKEVTEIYIHPEYNYTVYYNDIGILKLTDPAQITIYVRPVCLWNDDTSLNEIEGRPGTVVGWGFDQNRELSNSLMQAQMPVVSTSTCIYSNREFFSHFTSEKSFCAGFRNGTSVCNGDSGGGMVFPKRGTSGSTTIWQIRGLVSVGVALQGQGVCDPSQYIVFTDVAKHVDWIQDIVN